MWWEWCGKNTFFLLNDAMFATFFSIILSEVCSGQQVFFTRSLLAL